MLHVVLSSSATSVPITDCISSNVVLSNVWSISCVVFIFYFLLCYFRKKRKGGNNIMEFSTLHHKVEEEYEIYLISSPSLFSKCTFYNFVDFEVSIERNFDFQNIFI